MYVSPVAAVHVEEDDDKAKAVTGQVGAAEEPGESPRAMLPPRDLPRVRETKGDGDCAMRPSSNTLQILSGCEKTVERYR